MRVCHCHGVSDREITSLVLEGVEDAGEIGNFCGAGTRCGGCRPEVERLVRVSVERADRRLPEKLMARSPLADSGSDTMTLA